MQETGRSIFQQSNPGGLAPVVVTDKGEIKLITLEEAKEAQKKDPEQDMKLISFYSAKKSQAQQ